MTYSFNLNASQLIDISLKMMNLVSVTDSSQSVDYNFVLNVLNMMLKSWSNEGIKLWKRKQGVVFPSYNQPSYQVGSVTGSDNCCLNNNYIATTLSVAASTNATTITLSSVTGMSVNDKIGIELDDLSRQWTTINAINSTTKVITLNTALTNTSAITNTVVTYTSKINRPLEILRATLYDLTSNSETPIEKLTYDQFFNLPIKNNNGRPINCYYDRQLNNTLPYTGTLYLYSNPENSKCLIKFTYYDMIQDVVNTTDTLDIPQEGHLTVATNLAVMLDLLGYGKLQEASSTQALAAQLKEQWKDFDSDDEYLSITIDSSSRLNP